MKLFSGITSIKKALPPKILYSILAAFALLLITTIVFAPYVPFSITLKENDIATETLVSPRFLEFESTEDKKKTKILQQQRALLVKSEFKIHEEINKEIISNIVNVFTEIKNYKTTYVKSTPIPKSLSFLSRENTRFLKKTNINDINKIEYLTIQNTEKILFKGLKEKDLNQIKQSLIDNIKILNIKSTQKEFMFSIIAEFIKPNLLVDETKTKLAIQKEIQSIKPFTTILKEGVPIYLKGETITKKQIQILKKLNIYGAKANIYKFISMLIHCLFLFILFERFLYYFNSKVHNNPKYFILTYVVTILIILFARIIQDITFFEQGFNLHFLVPIPIAAIILSFLVTANISLLVGSIISILVALMYQADFQVFIYLFLCNAVTSFATFKKYKRTEIIVAGYIVGGFNVVIILVTGLFNEILDPIWFATNLSIGFANGVISAMISLAILPYFEAIFKVTTNQTLLELCNLNHPLLKKLLIKAPGTYQHSIMVANLAEAAAESINADPILTRVGAYFHDIGKTKRPIFFVENQFSIENPHQTLSPRLSTMIIAAHPKEGVELATKYKLPDILKSFMLEHHGTSLVSFFYSQALHNEELKDSESAKEEFRYPGPKPSFKESGIVMLADSTEAAVRALEKPTPNKIENLIEKIFKDKIDDKQLENCPLSLKEIYTIKETFLRILKSMYHSRINYQDELNNIIDQTKSKQD